MHGFCRQRPCAGNVCQSRIVGSHLAHMWPHLACTETEPPAKIFFEHASEQLDEMFTPLNKFDSPNSLAAGKP